MAVQVPIPDDWDGETFCRWSVCWPASPKWYAILDGLLTSPSRGRYWDAKTGNIIATQASFAPAYDANFILSEVIMACGDTGLTDLATAMNKIAIALQQQVTVNANCCSSGQGGSMGAGPVAPPFDPFEQTNPDTTPPPEGFDTWDDYFANKCAVAADIINNLQGTVANMATINFIGKTVATLAPILIPLILDPVPGDEILFLCGLLIAAFAEGSELISAMGTVLGDNEDDLKCALYIGAFSEASRERFMAVWNDAVDASSYDILVKFEIKAAMASMMTASITNRLYTLETDRILPSSDCSACECELIFVSGRGEGSLFPDGEERTLTAVFTEGLYRLDFAASCACSNGWQVEVVSMSGYVPHSGGFPGSGDRGGDIHDCDDVRLWYYNDGFEPIGTWCGSYFGLGSQSEGPFTAVVRISEGCL